MVPAEPTTVGQFRRGEIIGRGNFGVVYKGVDTKSKRVVAIKTLDLDAGVDEVESVQHEVSLLSRLSSAESSNVTKYYGSTMVGSKLWIIMDLCSGGSVRTLLKGGALEDRYLSVIFRETTTAVGAIHREGIIHRDIKAANVLITMTGQVKLCDFGVAAELSLSNKAKRTTIVGTPYWMAPEVITEGRSYDTKADIWSLGVTLYEMVTGNPPYTEYEAMRALMLISKSKPPRLEGPKYAPVLKDIIAICLDEVPEARPTAEELLKHKFVKQHNKVPTSVLRNVVLRYLDWKQKNANHRDSLLMFNPHQQNQEDEFDSGDDSESVWDFNIDPLDASTGVQMPEDDMKEAPDSLREVFGLPPKPQEDFEIHPAPILRRAMTEIAPSQSMAANEASAGPHSAIEPPPSHQIPPLPQNNGDQHPFVFPQAAQQHHQQHQHQHQQQHQAQVQPAASASHAPAQQHTPGSSGPTAPFLQSSLAQAQGEAMMTPAHTQSQPHLPLSQGLQGAQNSQRHPVNLSRAPTAVYASSRNRSTTVSASTSLRDTGRGMWRGRHGSEASTHFDMNQSQSLAALSLAQAQVQASVQEQQRQHPSQSQQQEHPLSVGPLNAGSAPTLNGQLSSGGSQPNLQAAAGTSSQVTPQLPRIPRIPPLDTELARASEPPSPKASVDHGVVRGQAGSAPVGGGASASQAPTASSTPWNKSPSPKRAPARQPIEGGGNAKASLPRLVMPSRGAGRPPLLMSAPAGANKQFLPSLPNIRRQTSPWVSEFPPMPKVDTNILLDSTPDNLAAEQLLELLMGFKTATASLAGQLEHIGPSSATAS